MRILTMCVIVTEMGFLTKRSDLILSRQLPTLKVVVACLRLLLLLPRIMEDRRLLVVYVFTSSKSPRGPPLNEGHWPKVRHETSVLEVPAQEQHEHSFCSSSSNTFIACFLYTVHRYRTSLGAPDL